VEEEKVQTLTSAREMKGEEEHSDKMLTQWEKELKLLEEWLSNLVIEEDCQRDAVVKSRGEEFHLEGQLGNAEFVSMQGVLSPISRDN
jgi:hypothetical protein